MTDIVKQILAKPIQLADQVIKSADEACINKQDCSELKSKTEKLAGLLRQAARASNDLYERPTKRIIEDTEQVLEKALSLVLKCRNNGLVKRVFTIIPAAAFRKMSSQLENSIGDVSWLLRVSAPNNSTDEYLGLPPLAKEGKLEGQENAALAIGLLGRDPESVEHMIHAGVCSVFVKILKEGPMKVQAVVAWAVAELVSHYPKCQDLFAQHNIVRLLVGHLAFETVEEHSKYAITSNKPTSIHAVVLASNNNSNSSNVGNNSNGLSNSQTNKGPVNNDEDEDKNRVAHPTGSNPQQPFRMHSVVTSTMAMKNQTRPPSGNGLGPNANQKPENVAVKKQNHHHYTSVSLSANSLHKGRELEDPATKAYMKAMAARALWHLAIGNSAICRSITESRALLCFAVLLEKGPEEVQFNSAMALMEITSVAEQDSELRRSAFKPNSPACKAVIEQLLKVIEKADSKLLLPCVKAIGNLARTFRATESQMIQPLVQLLDEREAEITRAATIALSKFACSENYLHLDHSKAIINAGGAKHLVQLVYFGEHMVQTPALVLLCYIALHVPDSEDLAQAEVLTVLEWASKQSPLIQDEQVESLLQNSKSRLELYQSRGSRGFH
ncbi:putative adaptor protein Cbl domain superfamily [Helianthus debilis subsp. tardiflorus]